MSDNSNILRANKSMRNVSLTKLAYEILGGEQGISNIIKSYNEGKGTYSVDINIALNSFNTNEVCNYITKILNQYTDDNTKWIKEVSQSALSNRYLHITFN